MLNGNIVFALTIVFSVSTFLFFLWFESFNNVHGNWKKLIMQQNAIKTLDTLYFKFKLDGMIHNLCSIGKWFKFKRFLVTKIRFL